MNISKLRDPRFRKKWEDSGSLGSMATARPHKRYNPYDYHLDFSLKEIEKHDLPSRVEYLIRQKARRDLPREQFEGTIDKTNPLHLVEINGIISVCEKGNVWEVDYVGPEKSIVKIHEDHPQVSTPHSFDKIDVSLLACHFIHYHSHPFEANSWMGKVSWADRCVALKAKKHIWEWNKDFDLGIKHFYMAVYLPPEDKFYWFRK